MAKAIITNKGFALLAKLTQGNTLKITGAVSGSGTVDAALLQEQTSVSNQKQTFTIENVSFPSERKCALILSLTNAGLRSGYPLSQIGIKAQDPDEGEVLFSIFQAEDSERVNIPSETVLPGYKVEWNYNLVFDNADIVNVDVDPANTVSRSAMEAYVSSEIAKITAESIGLGNVDNTRDTNKYVAYAQRAGVADKTESALTIRLNGGRTEGTDMWTFDGSTSRTVNVTPAKIGLGKVENTADSEKSVMYATSAGQSDKVKNSLTIKLNGGITEGADKFTFDGSMARTINLTPEALGMSNAKNADYADSAGKVTSPLEIYLPNDSTDKYEFDGSSRCSIMVTAKKIGALPASEDEDYPGCYKVTGPDGFVEWINPPMDPSGSYLTTERRGNKPVVVKCFDFYNYNLEVGAVVGWSFENIKSFRVYGVEGLVIYDDGSNEMHIISGALKLTLKSAAGRVEIENVSGKKIIGGYLNLKATYDYDFS